MRLFATFFLTSFFTCATFAQPALTKAANEAFLITRMMGKFHVQPREVDEAFSADVFSRVLTQLDRQKLLFTREDIAGISVYKLNLKGQIKSTQNLFLEKLAAIYHEKLLKADTMIDNVCKEPFNFTVQDKIPAEDDTSYSRNDAELRRVFTRYVKRAVLYGIISSNENLALLNPAGQKKFVDSIEPVMRKKVQISFKRNVQRKMQSPGGIPQLVGTEYCKAIASCFDPHSTYMPLTEKENFESELGRKQMDFGFTLNENADGNVVIEGLLAGSPAYRSGQLNEGDQIESIQWQGKDPVDVVNARKEEVTTLLGASNHEQATLKVKKADGSSRKVTLLKEQLETIDADEGKVKSYILNGDKKIGYISLPAFYNDWENDANINGCSNDVAKEIVKLKKENIEGLILDVRYNGGGSMTEAVELAGIFIDAGPVAMIKTKEQKLITLKDVNRGTVYDGPLIVMVNGYSASASEMLAGTLQDYNRALIVGTPTYGKASAQVILPLDTTIGTRKDFAKLQRESYLKVTTDQLYRVTGKTAQARGVKPDVLVPSISDIHPQHESDELFALRSPDIEPNKYYKAAPALPVNKLQDVARDRIESSTYFKELQVYIKAAKMHASQPESLKLTDVLQELKDDQLPDPARDSGKETDLFKVANHSYELQRLQADKRLEQVNEVWKSTVSKDPNIQLAYMLMQHMIK